VRNVKGSQTPSLDSPQYTPCVLGFTLLEILVVLLIIGIIASLAVLSVHNRNQVDDLLTEAQRLARLFELARQESVIQGREAAIELHRDSYRFVHWVQEEWKPVEDELLHTRHLPEGIRVEWVEIEGEEVAFDDTTLVTPPRIFLWSSGETTPFKLLLKSNKSSEDKTFIRLQGDVGGHLQVLKQTIE
jgi:general secretion pathway protein H